LKRMNINEINPVLLLLSNRFSYINSYSVYDHEGKLYTIIKKKILDNETENHFVLSVSNPIYDDQQHQIGILKGEFIFDADNIVMLIN
jgi:hypothetical protein